MLTVKQKSYGRETFLFSEIRVQIRVWPIDGRQWVARIGTVQGRTRRGERMECAPPPLAVAGLSGTQGLKTVFAPRAAGRRGEGSREHTSAEA